MLPEVTKRIQYNRANRDYDCFVAVGDMPEQFIGSVSNYSAGETLCSEYALAYYEDNYTPEKAARIVLDGCLPAEVAATAYPAFQRFVSQVETLGLPAIVIDLGAQLADELAAHIG